MVGCRLEGYRIKIVRKKAKLNQEDFAKKINLTKNYISLIETGNRIPSDRTISDICKEFDINESWLRTGEGGDENMYLKPLDQDRFSLNLQKLSRTDNEFIKHIVNLLAEADLEKLKILEEFMKKWLDVKK